MLKRAIFPLLCFYGLQLYPQQCELQYSRCMHERAWMQGYESDFCTAFSHYPELEGASIIIKRKDMRTAMAARPSFGSFFKGKKERTYVLLVDTLFNGRNGLFFDLSPEARSGLIGHELAHLAVYNSKNFFGLAAYGFVYLFGKRGIEHRTDEIALQHGLFVPLYEYARVVFDPSVVGEKYCRFKRKYYYSPDELEKIKNRSR